MNDFRDLLFKTQKLLISREKLTLDSRFQALDEEEMEEHIGKSDKKTNLARAKNLRGFGLFARSEFLCAISAQICFSYEFCSKNLLAHICEKIVIVLLDR